MVTRRGFLKLAGGMAATALTGCAVDVGGTMPTAGNAGVSATPGINVVIFDEYAKSANRFTGIFTPRGLFPYQERLLRIIQSGGRVTISPVRRPGYSQYMRYAYNARILNLMA